MDKVKFNVLSKTTGNKEVVRISVKDEGTAKEIKAGHIASFALKAMILEGKDVYISYVSGATSKLSSLIQKKEKVLLLMNRMLNDSLEQICGGFDKVPAQYVGKHLTVLTSLPYNKETPITSHEMVNGKSVFKPLEGFEDKTIKATFIRLHLAETVLEK